MPELATLLKKDPDTGAPIIRNNKIKKKQIIKKKKNNKVIKNFSAKVFKLLALKRR